MITDDGVTYANTAARLQYKNTGALCDFRYMENADNLQEAVVELE